MKLQRRYVTQRTLPGPACMQPTLVTIVLDDDEIAYFTVR